MSARWIKNILGTYTNVATGEVRDAEPDAEAKCANCGERDASRVGGWCQPCLDAYGKPATKPARKSRAKRRTPEEIEQARNRREQQNALKDAERKVWSDLLDSAGVTADNPPLIYQPPRKLWPGVTLNGVMVDISRVSGTGQIGSRLIGALREFDGAIGGKPGKRITLHVLFEQQGYMFRSRGCMLHRDEWRTVARALLDAADHADREDAAESASKGASKGKKK